jgi:hypothetical protein
LKLILIVRFACATLGVGHPIFSDPISLSKGLCSSKKVTIIQRGGARRSVALGHVWRSRQGARVLSLFAAAHVLHRHVLGSPTLFDPSTTIYGLDSQAAD